MGESNRYKKNTEHVSYEDVFNAFKRWDSIGGTLPEFEIYIGRNTSNIHNHITWNVTPQIAAKIRLLNNPNWKALLKIRRIRRSK